MHKNADLPPPPPLAELAVRCRVALFLDFDGTLVDIAKAPDAIRVPDDLGARLEELAARLDGRLALVSGRALADIGAHLGPAAVTTVGSHGAEFGSDQAPAFVPGAATSAAIAALTQRWPGLLVEHKPHGLAVHYRREPEAESAVLSTMDAIAAQEDMVARRGKMVVELAPAGASKGRAVARLMADAPFVGAVPLFIGDDITDEDGFAAAAEAGGHGVLVGPPRPTAAHFRLNGTEEVHRWLTL